jgi:GT2 family glycosyltransferase
MSLDFVIVTATRDSLITVKKCIEKIKEFTEGNYLHIISDDSSSPETLKYLQNLKNIKLLEYSGDKEPHLNIVMKKAFEYAFTLEPKYIITVESDVYVTPGWSRKLIKAIEQKEDAAGVTCITVNENKRIMPPMKNDLPPNWKAKGKWIADHFNDVVLMKKHLTFCCSIFKTSLCKQVDFVDVNRVAGVDVRYSARLRDLGYKLYVDLGMYVYHPSPHSSRREWRIKTNRGRIS